ncbi:hypothetical protein Nepgr_018424 [Nepenthes gracilis]|uniref:Protein LURP-one-related 6 n=1 Tax=Nepenthes gracilis TaxID=150966 RepID=A0AAD3SS89_NEPGR|nr:hypothetical protein Nepgr_018424 [Nepenthes gracilis]
MAAGGKANVVMMPIISKIYCSSSEEILVVRRRPQVVRGGGFVVTSCSQGVVFSVDGCGIVGKSGELVLRDRSGDAVLLIRQKGGMVQALSIHKQWNGYAYDYEGLQKMVFCVRQPLPFLSRNSPIRISIDPRSGCGRDWHFEIKGCFPERNCTIIDSQANIIAQIGVKEEVEKVMTSKDVYHVVVKAGIDQAFVIGVIAVLDYIFNESTRC